MKPSRQYVAAALRQALQQGSIQDAPLCDIMLDSLDRGTRGAEEIRLVALQMLGIVFNARPTTEQRINRASMAEAAAIFGQCIDDVNEDWPKTALHRAAALHNLAQAADLLLLKVQREDFPAMLSGVPAPVASPTLPATDSNHGDHHE